MAPDCIFNVTDLADNSFHGFFITNFITIVFLILCSVPFHVQLVTTCDKLHKLYFSRYFTGVFKKIHCVFQFADLESYLAHHNTYEASQHIRQEYQSRLHGLDDDQYYAEINRAYYSQETLAAQDYRPANQSAKPCRTMEELKRIFGRGRGQARREELHSHQPFGPRTRSLQSHIQRKIKKNQ